MAEQLADAFGAADQLANLLAHAPAGFLRDAEHAMQLHARHAVARRHEQVDGIEPRLERRAAVLEDRPGARVDVMAAVGAAVGLARRDPVERGVGLAAGAGEPLAEANRHHVVETRVFVGEAGEELADGELLGNQSSPMQRNLGPFLTCVKGINR